MTLKIARRYFPSAAHCWAGQLVNLNTTLDSDNCLSELVSEPDRELAWVKEKLQIAHLNHKQTNLNSILVILPSEYSPKRILMQTEDIIIEWVFFYISRVKG